MKARVVVGAVIQKDGEVLLGRKPKDIGPYPNTWVIPGGGVHLEDESLEEAMRREITEESGITVGPLEPLFFDEDIEPDKNGDQTHYLYVTYKTTYVSGTLKPGDDVSRLEWVKIANLPAIPLPRPSVKLFKRLGWL